jgi:AraC-like DNA-binding protein/mannose-6-phosphate isomerase-like protein (cupin superfamily)
METRHEHYKFYTINYNKDATLPCAIFGNVNRTPNTPNLKANWHKELELQYFISGEGYVLIDGERIDVKPGDIVVANSETVHYTGSESKMVYTAMIINSDFCLYADIDFTSVNFNSKITSERLERLFADVVAAYGEMGRPCKRARVQAALLRLLIELREYHVSPDESRKKLGNSYTQVKNTIQYIRENFSEKLTLDLLAENAHVDKFSLSRNFKAITGQTVVEYINNHRCERAKELIREGATVSEAATSCGFNNMSFFTKTFKTFTGSNPSEFKKL